MSVTVAANAPVIIVHGLWMHGIVMRRLARLIANDGFAVHTWSYPSMRRTLTENAQRLARYCATLNAPCINIIAHSMGGLVALKMLETTSDVHCDRLVLVGTPYTDSRAARRLVRWPGGTALLGRSIAEWLGTARPRPDRCTEIGVIAGTRALGLGRLVAPDLAQPNDGVVALAETEIPGVTQRIALHVGHSEMLLSRAVARQCCAFLHSGKFEAAD